MKPNAVKFDVAETIFYGLLAGAAVGLVFYLFHFKPVSYTILLITEGQWGEYLTSISYALSSVLFISLLFRPVPRPQKLVLAMMGLAAFLIGGEEINWGQSIFHFSTPSAISNANLQNQANFHNLVLIQSINYHGIVACIVLGWSIFSVAVSLWFPRLKNWVQTLGLPLIPIRIVLIFLTVPYFFLFYPVVKSDEVGELFLSIAVLVWASDMFIQHGWIKITRGLQSVISVFGVLLFAAVLSAGMTYRFPLSACARLNTAASRDYPYFGMYAQADRIYEYIYLHPDEYITRETRLNHARMLLKLGNKDKAFKILTEAANRLEASEPTAKNLSSNLRDFGDVLNLLEKYDLADAKFNLAIKVDEEQLESVSDPNERAELLWSIAKTLEDRGDISAAIEKAQQARSTAISAKLHWQLDYWIKTLMEKKE